MNNKGTVENFITGMVTGFTSVMLKVEKGLLLHAFSWRERERALS